MNIPPIRSSQKIAKKFNKNTFEYDAWEAESVVCGLDEVGRSCLAGPLVTAAVILPPNTAYRRLKDSKLLTEPERVLAEKWIRKNCWYGIGIVHHRIIDKHNIWHATLIAMKRALVQLLAQYPSNPQAILTDAMPLELWDTSYKGIPVYYFCKGEQKSSSIAAASILAKVTRDTIMRRFDSLFPGYYWTQNKGYGTKKHRYALYNNEPKTVIHRNSFLRRLEDTQKQPDQLSFIIESNTDSILF